MKSSVIAIIPARGGSKGLQRKNIIPLGGFPLIAWTIRAAVESNSIDRIIVSTEDEEIAEISRSFGAEVPFLRPADLATDTASVGDAIEYTKKRLREEGEECETHVTLFPTSPFRSPEFIAKSIALLKNQTFHIATVRTYKPNFRFWLAKNIDGSWTNAVEYQDGVFYEAQNILIGQTEIEAVFRDPDPDVRRRALIERLRNKDPRFQRTVTYLPIDNAAVLLDIDTPEDLAEAERAIQENKVPWTPGAADKGISLSPHLLINSKRNEIAVWIRPCGSPLPSVSLALSQLPTPLELRTIIDASTPFSGLPVVISAERDKKWPFATSSPSLIVEEDIPVSIGARRVFHVVDHCSFFIAPEKQLEFGGIMGTLPIFVHNKVASIPLDSIVQEEDRILVKILDKAGKTIMSSGLYLFSNNTWRFEKPSILCVEPQTLPLSFEGKTVHCICTEDTDSGGAMLIRPGYAKNNELEVLDAVDVPGFMRFDRIKRRWINEQTGHDVVGRQQLPAIHEWGGLAHLPAVVSPTARWDVVTDTI